MGNQENLQGGVISEVEEEFAVVDTKDSFMANLEVKPIENSGFQDGPHSSFSTL